MASVEAGVTRGSWPLILTIGFLNTLGMTIVGPVLPFIVLQYVRDESVLALWVGVLQSAYAACALVAAPYLGAISDRFGRKPVLVISLLGSVVGYVLFGIGGALWVLLLARMVDGFTAGDMPVIFAYVADVTPVEDRARRYGLLGAVSGVGFMMGPALGGLLSTVSLSLPVFATAAVAALVAVLGWFVLPESLAPEHRRERLDVARLHPLTVLGDAFARPELRGLLVGFALVTLPFGFFTSTVNVLAIDAVHWGPTQIGLLISAVGVLDIAVQGVLLRVLLPRLGERGIVLAGVWTQFVGCLGLAAVAIAVASPVLLAASALVMSMGQGGMGAAIDGLLSASVTPSEQGWLAGGKSSLNSLVQLLGPLLAGLLYSAVHPSAPYLLGVVLIAVAAGVLGRATRDAALGVAEARPAE